jgi:sphingolipid delta-4 desaturase
MTSASAKWHSERRKKILEAHPEIKNLPKENSRAILFILILPILQFWLAYYSVTLSLPLILLLGFFIGGQVNNAMFCYSHELIHGLVDKRLKEKWLEWIMHYASFACISPSTYVLYRFGHFSHHRIMGEGTLEQAMNFFSEPHPDVELLRDRYYYELVHQSNETPKALNASWFKQPYMRFLTAGIYFPLITIFKGSLFAHIVLTLKFFISKFENKPSYYHERVNAIFRHIVLFYLWFIPLLILAGPKVLIYLLIGDAADRGLFFHPKAVFIMIMHKTWGNHESYQPTTSIYSRFLAFVLMGQTYHVEHHDFPNIPCRYLPRVRAIAPEFYHSLYSYKGYFPILKDYFQNTHWIYAGAFGVQSK